MTIWIKWLSLVRQLRPAFSRNITFLWFVTNLAAISIRSDLAGITSFIRGLSLSPRFYSRMLEFFNSKAIKLDELARLWTSLVLRLFPGVLMVNGRYVLVGDGVKISKEGRKMPGVKCLHQESDSNSKPKYIMGHSCQVLSILCGVSNYFFAVPLISRIHEGVVTSNRDHRTLLDKFIEMLNSLVISMPCYIVVDAYYGSRKMIHGLKQSGHHLICRAKKTAVAYYKPIPRSKPSRGRPKTYGDKQLLKNLFQTATFTEAISQVYGEIGVTILYYCIDLLWKPVGELVRFVLVIHPTRGQIIFMSSDLTLGPLDIIKCYGLRYKIEVSFKQAIHTIGTYAYHFWMQTMIPIKRYSGNQYIHRQPEEYRDQVRRKIRAYNIHQQLGVIAQGLMQYLSLDAAETIWGSFGSWIRTIRPGVLPSEAIVGKAMANSFEEFLDATGESENIAKFILAHRGPPGNIALPKAA
jgi:hypothetical protein